MIRFKSHLSFNQAGNSQKQPQNGPRIIGVQYFRILWPARITSNNERVGVLPNLRAHCPATSQKSFGVVIRRGMVNDARPLGERRGKNVSRCIVLGGRGGDIAAERAGGLDFNVNAL